MPVINTIIRFRRFSMATVTYAYAAGQTVWVITDGSSCPSAVRTGDITSVRINIIDGAVPPATNTEILYNVLLTGDNGPTTLLEADVFATLSAATTEYQIRLT